MHPSNRTLAPTPCNAPAMPLRRPATYLRRPCGRREGVGLSTSASVLLVYCCMTPLGILTGRAVLALGQQAAPP